MKKFRYYRRSNGVYYAQDSQTGKQHSIKTRDENEARAHVDALNQGVKNPAIARKQALATLAVTNSQLHNRKWRDVMEAVMDVPAKSTRQRRESEFRCKVYDVIRDLPILETEAEDFRRVLRIERASSHLYLKTLQNYALDAGWLHEPVLPKRQWPTKPESRRKRAISEEEQHRILESERNSERSDYYQFLWETGASQTDAAKMTADCIDWKKEVLAFTRSKTGEMCILGIGTSFRKLLERLPEKGALFPMIGKSSAKARASEFGRRCRCCKVSGVSLHSYRYSWAQRAFKKGYPERWARQCLGHSSKAIHQAYSKNLELCFPSMEDYGANKGEGESQ